ncbi:MAG: DUF5662 family protein [Clostridia bacterium]|nr:DUF5662 family protein [Clostridia bacterium]
MNKFFGHLSTVLEHKKYVRKACFKMGLYGQGLTHDLSKFSPTEFIPSVHYFLGTKSPTTAERQDKGYSTSWMHHQGRNKHHFEYWVDYTGKNRAERAAIEMPLKYVAEMVADRYAACKTYHKADYKQTDALEYFAGEKDKIPMHPNTKALLEEILTIMANDGENAAFAYVKKLLKEQSTR